MDRFLVTLDRGNNILTRDSCQTPVTGKPQRSLLELQQALLNNMTDFELGIFQGCVWPQHLLLSRGTKDSVLFTMFVVVSISYCLEMLLTLLLRMLQHNQHFGFLKDILYRIAGPWDSLLTDQLGGVGKEGAILQLLMSGCQHKSVTMRQIFSQFQAIDWHWHQGTAI